MDGWIGLSGCGCEEWKVNVESGCGKWIVESGKWKVARFRISHVYELSIGAKISDLE